MEDKEDRPKRLGRYIRWLCILSFLYILSSGPFIAIAAKMNLIVGAVPERIVHIIYAPLTYPWRGFVGDAIASYVEMWISILDNKQPNVTPVVFGKSSEEKAAKMPEKIGPSEP